MSLMMQSRQMRALSGNAVFSSKPLVSKRALRQPRLIVQAGLFNFLSQPSPAKTPNRANELVDELFALTRKTDAGKSFSESQRAQVRELIEELSQFCPRQPLRSKLLFGTYEVLYAFAKDAVGGPLRTGAGPILFPGQKPFQILEEPNRIVNRLEFSTLGFLPGYGQQTGTFRPLSSDTFELTLTERQVNNGFGGEQVAEINFVRKIQILYLDERVRVARFIPDASPDEEPRDDLFFVFERVVEVTKEEPVAQEAPAKGTTIVPIFGGSQGRKPGKATIAERKVRQQLEADAQSSGKAVPTRGTGVVRAARPAGTSILKAKPAAAKPAAAKLAAAKPAAKEVDPRVAAAEKRRAEAEAAKARAREEQERAKAKQREAEEKAKREEAARLAKERAEAERQAKQQRLAAVKEALNKLGAEIQEAQVASRAAKVELRDIEKETQSTNRKTAEARAQLEAAVARTQSATGEVQAALEARNNAQSEAREAQAALKEADKKYREQLALFARK